MDSAAFAELLTKLRERPRMWLPDERFTTLVGFVEGVDAASGGAPLGGFREYLAERYLGHESSIAWWGLVGDHVAPNHSESREYYGRLDENASRPFNAELLDRLLDFLGPTS